VQGRERNTSPSHSAVAIAAGRRLSIAGANKGSERSAAVCSAWRVLVLGLFWLVSTLADGNHGEHLHHPAPVATTASLAYLRRLFATPWALPFKQHGVDLLAVSATCCPCSLLLAYAGAMRFAAARLPGGGAPSYSLQGVNIPL